MCTPFGKGNIGVQVRQEEQWVGRPCGAGQEEGGLQGREKRVLESLETHSRLLRPATEASMQASSGLSEPCAGPERKLFEGRVCSKRSFFALGFQQVHQRLSNGRKWPHGGAKAPRAQQRRGGGC